jgi:hypothetical protein
LSWQKIAPRKAADGDRAVVLDDGRVLVTGKAGSHIYNPARDRWAETGQPVKADLHSRPLVRTAEGWVLAAGGYAYHSLAVTDCELWKANAWLAMPPLPVATNEHACIARHDRVYVLGGAHMSVAQSRVASWAPGEDAWREEAPMPRALYAARATRLDDHSIVAYGEHVLHWDGAAWSDLGEVPRYCDVVAWRDGFLVVGGRVHEPSSDTHAALASVRAWTRARGWHDRGDLPAARWAPTCVRLADGRVAIVGGTWTERSHEDTSTGGELDYEYRSSMAWIVTHHKHDTVLLEHGDGWQAISAPSLQGRNVLALPDGRLIADMQWIWTPPT